MAHLVPVWDQAYFGKVAAGTIIVTRLELYQIHKGVLNRFSLQYLFWVAWNIYALVNFKLFDLLRPILIDLYSDVWSYLNCIISGWVLWYFNDLIFNQFTLLPVPSIILFFIKLEDNLCKSRNSSNFISHVLYSSLFDRFDRSIFLKQTTHLPIFYFEGINVQRDEYSVFTLKALYVAAIDLLASIELMTFTW